MKRLIALLPLAALLAAAALPARASHVFYQGNVDWWLGPPPEVYVPVFIHDLALPPGLGGFRFELRFNAAEFSFGEAIPANFVLGNQMRDQFTQTIVRYPVATGDVEWTGRVDITWTSLLSPAELLAGQSGDFPLLVLYMGFHPGGLPDQDPPIRVNRRIQLTGELFDAYGAPIPDVGFINDVVPEPGTGWALAAGVTLLAALARRRAAVSFSPWRRTRYTRVMGVS